MWAISVVMWARKTQCFISKLVHLQQDRSPLFSVFKNRVPRKGHSQLSKSQPVLPWYNHVWEKYQFLKDFLNKKATYEVCRNKGITLMPAGHHYIIQHILLPCLSPAKSAPGLK